VRYLVVLLPFLLVATALAGDAPSPEDVADEVVRLHEAGDAAALKELALKDVPDPWRVAHVLDLQGRHEAALAFARAGSRPATKGLVAYLQDALSVVEPDERMAVLARARTVAAGGRPEDALKMLRASADGRESVLAVECAAYRSELYKAVGNEAEAARALEESGDHARALGWLTYASQAYFDAGSMQHEIPNDKRALSLFERRLEVETELGSTVGMGRAHYGIAIVLPYLGRVDDANRHHDEAYRLAKEGGDRYYLAKALSSKGIEQARVNDGRGALATFAEALEVIEGGDASGLEPRFRPEPERVARLRVDLHTNSVSMARKLFDEPLARKHARLAVEVARESGDALLLDRTQAFLALVEAAGQENEGHPLAALGHLERARGLYARLSMRFELADVLRRLGSLRESLGDLPAALQDEEEAIRALRDFGATRALCDAYLSAGTTCLGLQRGSEAEVHLQTALRLARILKDLELETDVLEGLSRLRGEQGQYRQALDLLEEAMRIHEQHPGKTEAWTTEQGLASLYQRLGDVPRATAMLERALKSLAESSSRTQLRDALRRQQSDLLIAEQKWDEADAILADVLADHQRSANRSGVADLLYRRSEVALFADKYERSHEYAEQAVGLYVAMGDLAEEVKSRVIMGRALLWMKERDRALDELTYAHQQAVELGDTKRLAYALSALAEVRYMRGEFADAMRRAEEGAQLISRYAMDLAEGERAVIRERFESLPRWGLAAAVKLQDHEGMYRFLERGRSSSLVASLGGRTALRAAQAPVALRRAEEEARGASAIAFERYEEARRAGKLEEARTLKQALEAARTREQDAISAVQRARRSQADLGYAEPTPLAEVRKALAGDEALVLYGHDGWRYVALLITRERVRDVTIGAVRPTEAAIDQLAIEPDAPTPPSTLSTVADLVIGALKLDEGTKRVLISPCNRLAYLPYGAMVGERSVCLVPSGTAWHMLHGLPAETGTKVLALGDPLYQDTAATADAGPLPLRGGRLAQLPATRKEVESIGDVVLVGKEASETRFRATIPDSKRWRAVHLACHGIVDDVMPTRSALVLTNDDQNDGFLYASELFDQIQVPADLVVLSACETGRGRVYLGEGLVGLSRAFMLAGTPRVVASLWKVDDEATQALMLKFYELWNPKQGTGMPAAEALQRAQAFVRSQPKWHDPFYWAAWVLWGLPE